MNENEWDTSTNPVAMVKFLTGRTSDRKLRLFAAAGCRRVAADLQQAGLDLLGEGNNGVIVAAIEEGADALLGDVGMSLAALQAAMPAHITVEVMMIREAAHADAAHAAANVAFRAPRCFRNWSEGDKIIAAVVREIFGNPFRQHGGDEAIKGAPVQEVAAAIYTSRDFGRLPELADRLEAVQCADNELLAHFRSPGPHYRGCWALDSVLGKE